MLCRGLILNLKNDFTSRTKNIHGNKLQMLIKIYIFSGISVGLLECVKGWSNIIFYLTCVYFSYSGMRDACGKWLHIMMANAFPKLKTLKNYNITHGKFTCL